MPELPWLPGLRSDLGVKEEVTSYHIVSAPLETLSLSYTTRCVLCEHSQVMNQHRLRPWKRGGCYKCPSFQLRRRC